MQWLAGLRPDHAEKSEGIHLVDSAQGTQVQARVPPGVPKRWADLEPLLWMRFRTYTRAEAEAATEDSSGYAIVLKARRKLVTPANGVWIGRPYAKIEDKQLDAERLLCLKRDGATLLPFTLAVDHRGE